MQMLPKYHHHVFTWKKRNNQFLFGTTKEWYTDICQVLLMRSLFYVLTAESFLSVMNYFLCILVWCMMIVVLSHLRFNFDSLMDDCSLKSQHPKMYKSLFIKLLDRGQVDRVWEKLFMNYDDMLILIWKLYCLINSYLWIVFQLTMMTISVIETHFEKIE